MADIDMWMYCGGCGSVNVRWRNEGVHTMYRKYSVDVAWKMWRCGVIDVLSDGVEEVA